jgi:multiple antibiotic resistance protein
MDQQFLITAFFTLFVIIDPIGLAPIYLALTTGMDTKKRRMVGLRAIIIGFGVLMLFGVFGEAVLGFIGISMAAFRIAGGILLFLTALEMLFEKRTKRREDQVSQANSDDLSDGDDPSVFPLATPLIAGPGAIATLILLTGQSDGVLETTAVFGVLLAVLALAMVLFWVAEVSEKLIGPTGINVITRLLGMLLAALSVQFILDGLREFGALNY